jgi:hypothetical protein
MNQDVPEPGLRTAIPVEVGTIHVTIDGVHVVPIVLH